jgi:glucose/arabinose dehydrogenase
LQLKKPEIPFINDPNLKVEMVFKGLKFPTSMAFLDQGDILVLEKNNGTVQRIVNGTIQPQPMLDVNVANKNERGMLGIAVSKHENGSTYVFLYYTEAKVEGSDDICPDPNSCEPGTEPPLGNRLYRYELVNNKLVNPVLLLDLPAIPGPSHNGGKVVIGPDNNVYLTIGDVNGYQSRTQNIPNEPDFNGTSAIDFNGTSAIYRITQDGQPLPDNPLGSDTDPPILKKYFAYGLRNSFGIAFDPVTGKLWDTENGDGFGDEINLVQPGFNSGWKQVQGIWKPLDYFTRGFEFNPNGDDGDSNDLVDFDGKGKYSDPEFIWNETVGPTAIKFINSDKLGKKYQYDMLIGDIHNGNIYHFDLNKNRTKLFLTGALYDMMADNSDELQDVIFSRGFGGITDIEVGPDGYIYFLSIADEGGSYNAPLEGSIFRIVTATTKEEYDLSIHSNKNKEKYLPFLY